MKKKTLHKRKQGNDKDKIQDDKIQVVVEIGELPKQGWRALC